MAQSVIEVKPTNSKFLNTDNSYFDMILGEPIYIKAGSTIDYMDGIIDLGTTSDTNITVAYDMLLGINFYVYEYDTPKVPDNQGSIANYRKRNIYIASPPDVPIEGPSYPALSYTPNKAYGEKLHTYYPSCLPSFLCQRTGTRQLINEPPFGLGTWPIVEENFIAQEQTATILIKKGTYSKTKFAQIVNDGFNLINGSLTNQDKPAENITGEQKPFTTTPVDFSQYPNNNSQILKSYIYPYSISSQTAETDPLAWNDPEYPNQAPIYPSDIDFSIWFCPIYTKTYPDNEVDEPYMPYTWFNTGQSGFMAGTTKFNLEYDTDSNLFYIDYLHSAILDKQQRETVIITPVQTKYATSGLQTIGYKSMGSLGGIMISRLFSYKADSSGNPIDGNNTNFWQEHMGFGFNDDYQSQFKADMQQTTNNIYYNVLSSTGGGGRTGLATRIQYKFNINYPHPKYFNTSTTTPLVPIQWLQQSNYTTNANDYGMSIISQNLPKVFQSVGTIPILGSDVAFDKPIPYYLIEVNINSLKNDNWRDEKSNYQIMNIAGRTYTTGDYLQSFDDGAVEAINIYEDIKIDKISIKILNPDKTFASGLGNSSTIFLKITQPIVFEKK